MGGTAGEQSRSRDLDNLLVRQGNLVGSTFVPGPKLQEDRNLKRVYVKILVVEGRWVGLRAAAKGLGFI